MKARSPHRFKSSIFFLFLSFYTLWNNFWNIFNKICLLHFNEFPLRALFYALDGETLGAISFTALIEKKLKTYETFPVFQFKK